MDWLIGLSLLLVGGIIGFFIARHLYSMANSNANAAKQNEQTIKEIMAQQAEQHIYSSRQTLEQMQRNCHALAEQLASYESLLQHKPDVDENNKLSYFGEQASAYLRNKQANNKRTTASADIQPKDFAGESSGLFVGKNPQHTAEDK